MLVCHFHSSHVPASHETEAMPRADKTYVDALYSRIVHDMLADDMRKTVLLACKGRDNKGGVGAIFVVKLCMLR